MRYLTDGFRQQQFIIIWDKTSEGLEYNLGINLYQKKIHWVKDEDQLDLQNNINNNNSLLSRST